MVNNYHNISKTNNHHSPKTIHHKAHGVGNPGPNLGLTQKCGGVKPANGITTLPSDNWISSDTTHINKQTNTDSLPLKTTTLYQKMNNSLNMDSTIVVSIRMFVVN
jgi:hypothetical protein